MGGGGGGSVCVGGGGGQGQQITLISPVCPSQHDSRSFSSSWYFVILCTGFIRYKAMFLLLLLLLLFCFSPFFGGGGWLGVANYLDFSCMSLTT